MQKYEKRPPPKKIFLKKIIEFALKSELNYLIKFYYTNRLRCRRKALKVSYRSRSPARVFSACAV